MKQSILDFQSSGERSSRLPPHQIYLEPVVTDFQKKTVKRIIKTFHSYVKQHMTFGRRLNWLIYNDEKCVGTIGISDCTTFGQRSRDDFIGWTKEDRKTKSRNFTTGEEGFILFSESCQSCNPVSSYSVFSSDGFMVLRSFRAHANLKYPGATAVEVLYFVCSVERFFRTAAILAAIRKRMPAGCRRYGRSNTNRLNFARASQRFNSAHFVRNDVPMGGLGL